MKKRLVVLSAFCGCAVLALADDVKQSSASSVSNMPVASATKAGAPDKEPYLVIGYLEKRNCVITIKSSPHGTIYDVATKDGKVLHENVSAEQLKAQAPEIYEVIKTGNANDASLRVSAVR